MPSLSGTKNNLLHQLLGFIFCLFGFLGNALAEPWAYHSTHLPGLVSQIKMLEKSISELVEQKKKTEDPAALKGLLESIKSSYAELQKVSSAYETERRHVRFKHPEENDDSERKYPRYHLKSLSDLESQVGLEARLDHVKARVLAIYPVPKSEDDEDNARNQKSKKFQLRRAPSSVEFIAPEEHLRLVK